LADPPWAVHNELKNISSRNPLYFQYSDCLFPQNSFAPRVILYLEDSFSMPKPDQPLSDQPLSDEEILVKHIFRGSSFAVVRLEEITEIGNLKADAVSCYRPVNAQELWAVERIALCQQKMLRGERLESGLFTTALDYCLERDGRPVRLMNEKLAGDGDIEITRAQNRNFALGEGFRIMMKESNVWSILMRYQTNAERQYRRAVEDWERLSRLRPQMPNHPDLGAAPDPIDDIAPIEEINPSVRPEPVAAEPAAPAVETPNAPEDATSLAPAAASTSKKQEPTSRVHSSDAPEAGRLKVAPLALPLRRSRHPRSTPAAPKTRRRTCRPIANPSSSSAAFIDS
jgi:hypothetical protein